MPNPVSKRFSRFSVVFSILLLGLITVMIAGCGGGGSGSSGGTVTGIVSEETTGNPVAGAVVTLGGKTGTTDARGRFTIPSVPGGTQTVRVTATGYGTLNTTGLVSGNTTHNYTLTTTAPLLSLGAHLSALSGTTLPEGTIYTIAGDLTGLIQPRTAGGSTSYARFFIIFNGQYFEVTPTGEGLFCEDVPLITGTNVLQIAIMDADDAMSVSEAITFTSQVPRSDIRAVLSWDTSETDIDLHLFRRTPNPWSNTEDWWNDDLHVYFSNQTPSDWGGAAVENPTLDTDDTYGYGPETIILPNAAAGTYALWVHDWSGDPITTTATVKLWLFAGTADEILRTYTITLDQDHLYKNVATFTLPSGSFGSPMVQASMFAQSVVPTGFKLPTKP